MKTTYKLTFKPLLTLWVFALLALTSFQSKAQCNAFFFSYTSGATATFYDSSSTSSGKMSHYWTFGDGDTSTLKDPHHTYASSGTYWVCEVIGDSACQDTFCDTVFIGSFVPCSVTLTCFYDSLTNEVGGSAVTHNTNGNVSYSWDWGDGTYTGNVKYAKHTYSSPGTYYVCVTITDNNCTSQDCKYVVIPGQARCDASFQDSIIGLWVGFSPTSTGYGIVHYWTYGDGNTGTTTYGSNVYASNGTYTVCHIVVDTINNCSDTSCLSVVLGSTFGCNAAWTYGIQNKTAQFKPTYTNANYSWTFGDGGTSTSNTGVTHTYTANGTYTVCLIVSDSGCSDTSCSTITVGIRYCVSGKITLGNTAAAADYGTVWLIKYDTAAGTLTAIDSVSIDSNGYYNICAYEGYYLLKAALSSSSTSYSNYLPTYYNDKLHWDTANLVHLNTGQSGKDIHLIAGSNPGGPGFIGGFVSLGANKTDAVGDPMPGVEVILKDASKTPVKYVYSDAQGKFSFSGLPYGTYYVSPEIVGKQGVDFPVSISSSSSSVNNVKVEVNSTYASVSLKIDVIAGTDASNILSIYPNPASNVLMIDLKTQEVKPATVIITDVTGKQLQTLKLNGMHTELDVQHLPSGMYMMTINGIDNRVINTRFIKH